MQKPASDTSEHRLKITPAFGRLLSMMRVMAGWNRRFFVQTVKQDCLVGGYIFCVNVQRPMKRLDGVILIIRCFYRQNHVFSSKSSALMRFNRLQKEGYLWKIASIFLINVPPLI